MSQAAGLARGDPGDPHGGGPVRRAGAPAEEADAAMVLLHGRGGSPEDVLTLAREWDAPDVALVAPMAARRTWYPYSFMAPTDRNEPHLSSALRRVGALVEELGEAGLGAERVILLGFSQGACLASEFVQRNPRRYGGLAALSGGLIGPEGTSWDTAAGSLDGTPAFLGCSDRDPHIPRERVEESARILETMGADVEVRIYEEMGHTVNRDEIERVQEMIDGLGESLVD